MALQFLSNTNNTGNFTYNCAAVGALPYQGTEILVLGAVLLVVVVSWSLVYLDVVAKQWLPAKMLSAEVQTRVAWVQKNYPNITLSDEEKRGLYLSPDDGSHYAALEDGTKVEYDAVAAQESYISAKSVDLDLLTVLANNSAYSTMSEYSANTTRGYNMLSTMLSGAAFCSCMFCLHNFIVDPKSTQAIDFSLFGVPFSVRFGVVALFFYPGILCTAIVMTGAGSTVWRDSNICLVSNVPYQLHGKYNPIRHLHVGGVVLYGIPIFCHLIQALAWGKENMPNYTTATNLMLVTLAFALVFAAAGLFGKLPHTTRLQGKKVSILGEAGMMFACILSYVHWETYATAACTGHESAWEKIIVGAFFAPFALVARHQLWAPTQFSTTPSLMLMRLGAPVATVGPCPAKAYRGGTMSNGEEQKGEEEEEEKDASCGRVMADQRYRNGMLPRALCTA